MDHLFDPASPPAATEWERGTGRGVHCLSAQVLGRATVEPGRRQLYDAS